MPGSASPGHTIQFLCREFGRILGALGEATCLGKRLLWGSCAPPHPSVDLRQSPGSVALEGELPTVVC